MRVEKSQEGRINRQATRVIAYNKYLMQCIKGLLLFSTCKHAVAGVLVDKPAPHPRQHPRLANAPIETSHASSTLTFHVQCVPYAQACNVHSYRVYAELQSNARSYFSLLPSVIVLLVINYAFPCKCSQSTLITTPANPLIR